MSEKPKGVMIKVAELYREPTNGEGLCLSGSVDQGRILIRPVEERESDKHPDHEMFLFERVQPGGDETPPKGIRIGVLWTGTKNGNVYLSGTFWMARCVIFRNSYREGPEDPDFKLYVTVRQERRYSRLQRAVSAHGRAGHPGDAGPGCLCARGRGAAGMGQV